MLFRDLSKEDQSKFMPTIRLMYNTISARSDPNFDPDYDQETIMPCECSKTFKWASMRFHINDDGSRSYVVYCMKCTQIGQLGNTPTEATKLWNAEMLLLQE